jgi:choline dehydrogenase-like flavoprotein
MGDRPAAAARAASRSARSARNTTRPSTSHRPKSGAVIHAQTTATKVEIGAEGSVSAISFKRWDGSEGVVKGKVFVLAAHAIEIPRLLLHSRSEALPSGVANRAGQVGRNVMDHPTQLSWALSPEPVWP